MKLKDKYEENNEEGICDDCKYRFSETKCNSCNYLAHKKLLIELYPNYLKQEKQGDGK